MVIFADADLDAAVEGLVNGVWFNGGQVCCAGSRVLVQEGVAAEFVAKAKVSVAAPPHNTSSTTATSNTTATSTANTDPGPETDTLTRDQHVTSAWRSSAQL